MSFFRTSRGQNRKRWQSTFEVLESRRVLAIVAGTVYEDANANATPEENEPRIPGVVVFIDSNQNGRLDQRGFGLDPDEFTEGAVLSNSQQTVFPSATGIDNEPAFRVRALKDTNFATTGDLVFGQDDTAAWNNGRRLRFDFTLPVDSVSLDAVGATSADSAIVTLDAYAKDGQLLESDQIAGLANASVGRLNVERPQKDIGYIVAYVSSVRGAVRFDNLRADNAGDERSTFTSEAGFYRFVSEPEGEITVAQQVPEGYSQTSPFPELSYTTFVGSSVSNLDFGNRTSSIEGFAFNDTGILGVFEPSLDEGIAGSAVYLDLNRNGVPDQASISIDPDVFLADQVLEFVSSEVAITTANGNNQPGSESVTAAVDEVVDSQVFSAEGNASWNNDRRLRFDFKTPASTVELDFVAASGDGPEKGILIAYSQSGNEIASTTTRLLEQGQRETMALLRSGFDISFVVAYTVESPTDEGRLDNLRATTVVEPVAVSNDSGEFVFRPLREGEYRVGALPVGGRSVSFPNDSFHEISLDVGDQEFDANFGFRSDNRPPVARADSITTIEENPIAIGVLSNDSDPDGVINQGSLVITQNPSNGVAVVTADGFIDYTPNENFSGRDTLIYTVRDDQSAISNSALVTIDVIPVNDSPIAIDDAVNVLNMSPTVIDVVRNDRDVDGTIDPTTVEIVSPPSNGTTTVDEITGNVTYTPTDGGSDSFTYTVRDDAGANSNIATVTIRSLAAGVAPVARNDSTSTLEGTRKDIPLLVNDTDADGAIDPNSIVIVSAPAHGQATVASGSVSYQPELGYVGEDSFSYLVRDDSGFSSNDGTVTIDITERDFPYQNPINSLDVNADGFIVPRDALLIINEINNRRFSDEVTGATLDAPEAPNRPNAYYDVTGDGFVVSTDVLRIVNFLNAQSAAAEPSAADNQAAVAAAFATGFDALNDDDDDEEDLAR